MEAILAAPALAKILGILLAILLVMRAAKSMALGLFVGSVLLGLWQGRGAEDIIGSAWGRLASIDMASLCAALGFILLLSSHMARSGLLKELVGGVRARFPKRFSGAALPALIGFLPMPRGALFSAPLVQDADPEGDMDAIAQTRINYCCRHAWEPFWPLFPGVILAMGLSGIPVHVFVPMQAPIVLVALAVGWAFYLKAIPKREKQGTSAGLSLMPLVAPILSLVLVYALIQVFLPEASALNAYIPMSAGAVAALLCLQALRPLPAREWLESLKKARIVEIALIVAGIRLYGAFVDAPLPGGGLMMDSMRAELDWLGVPPLALIAVLPFLAGLVTGIAMGYVGASFPVVLGRVGGAGAEPGVLLPAVMLAYTSGWAGMMISPVHICAVVSAEYFKAPLIRSNGGIALPALIVLAFAFALSRALGALL